MAIAFLSFGSYNKSNSLDEIGTEPVKVEASKMKAPRKAPAKKKG
jgi:hypothetical protein